MPGANKLYMGANRATKSGLVLFSGAPNGPYGTSPWAAPLNVTLTTGQTDPNGGTGASLATDTATNAQHYLSQGYGGEVPGATYLVTAFIKPGTYTGQITIQSGAAQAVALQFNPSTHAVTIGAGPVISPAASAVGNGFWQISFSYVSVNSGAGTFIVGFGANFPAYAGTLQNFTLYGASLQQVI